MRGLIYLHNIRSVPTRFGLFLVVKTEQTTNHLHPSKTKISLAHSYDVGSIECMLMRTNKTCTEDYLQSGHKLGSWVIQAMFG